MPRRFVPALAAGLILGVLSPLGAQEAKSPGGKETLEFFQEEAKVLVATKIETPLREAPGIISVVTREEIQDSGARDFIDVLRLVPGFEFGTDVQGVVSIGIRGNWAEEGKVLVLLDGQELNERLYANIPLGNRIPVDQIQRVEIIRGPGSVVHGGYAELGVINIVTQGPKDLNGGRASLAYGGMSKALGLADASLSYGRLVGNTGIDGKAFVGYGQRSDKTYTDAAGSSYAMGQNSKLDPSMVNVGVEHKGLHARFIYERYQTTERDQYGTNLSWPTFLWFKSYWAAAGYDQKLGDSLTLTPSFNYSKQWSWQEDDAVSSYDNFVERYKWGLMAKYDAARTLNIIAGSEFYNEEGHVGDRSFNFGMNSGSPVSTFLLDGNRRTVYYFNQAYYAQTIYKGSWATLVLGARYENHSKYDPSFLPRASLMKAMGGWHAKLLYSKAFRPPSIENIALSPNWNIEPERTTALECEAGYRLNKKSSLTLNLFDITIRSPIVYFHDNPANTDNYRNLGQTGSSGAEIEYKVNDSWGHAAASYSFYTTNKNNVDLYRAESHKHVLLGFPAQKAALNLGYKVAKTWTVGPSAVFLSQRYGYTGVDPAGNPILERFTPVLLANLFVRSQGLFGSGLGLGVGVFNIFDQRYGFIQPYNRAAGAVHPSIPGPSRELVVKLSYDF